MAQNFYPKGRLAYGPGDLVDAFDVNWSGEDGIKSVATLRNPNAGETSGAESDSITFKSHISEQGFERDYMTPWRAKKKVQLRFKVPGLTLTIEGRFSKPNMVSNVDGTVEFTVTIVGRVSFSKV
jgi:hypothetical protein